MHFYAGSHLPGDYVMQDMDYALKKGVPIFVSEWGPTTSNGDGGPFFENADKWLNYLNKNNISWCDFCLTNKKEKSATFINYEYGKTNATLLDPGNDQKWNMKELTATGEYIRARIKGIPYQPVNRGNRKDYSNVAWNFDNGSQGFGVDADSPVKDVNVENVNNALQISGLSKSNDISMGGFWSNVRISSDWENASQNIWGAEKLTLDVIADKPTTVSIAAIPQNETHPWENPAIAERVNPEDFKLQKDGTYKALMTILSDDAPGLQTIGQDCGHSILENIVLFVGSESDVISLDNITISGNSRMKKPVQHDPLGKSTIPSSFEDNTRNGWEWSTASTVNSKMTIKNANKSKALSWEMGYPKYKPTDTWSSAAMLTLPAVNTTIGDNDKFVFDLYIAPKHATKGGINIAANCQKLINS
jgi:endoglucanase